MTAPAEGCVKTHRICRWSEAVLLWPRPTNDGHKLPVESKNLKHLPAQTLPHRAEGRALGLCSLGAAAAHAGLAAVAARAAALIWKLSRTGF